MLFIPLQESILSRSDRRSAGVSPAGPGGWPGGVSPQVWQDSLHLLVPPQRRDAAGPAGGTPALRLSLRDRFYRCAANSAPCHSYYVATLLLLAPIPYSTAPIAPQ